MIALLLSMLPMFQINLNNLLNGLLGSNGCGLLSSQMAAAITANEPWYCPISNQVTTQWGKWLPAMLVVTLISFLLAALIFMVGVGLGSAKIRSYGVAEFYEAIATAIIVVGFVYVCAVLFGLGPGILVGGINPYATAFNLIGQTISQTQTMYNSLYTVNFYLSETTSVGIGFGGSESGIVKKAVTLATSLPILAQQTNFVAAAYSTLITVFYIDPATALSTMLYDGMTILYGEYYLLLFFCIAAIPCFLVPGIIFRALLPTRGLGGIMISMAIGFYLVMPALFSAAYYFTAPSLLTSINIANAQIQALPLNGAMVTGPTSPLIVDLNNSQSALSGFWMLIFFYPAMIIGFTYSFVVQLSKVIGGTYQSNVMKRVRSFI